MTQATIRTLAAEMFDAFIMGGETAAREHLEHAIDMLAECQSDAAYINEHATSQYRVLQYRAA